MPMTFREAEKLLLKHGWVWLKQGKGSHRLYIKKGAGAINLPWHSGGKDLPSYLEKQIKNKLGLK